MIRKKFKQIFCKHQYKPWANIQGDLISLMGAQTVYLCKKCFKRKFKKEYVEAPLNYNQIMCLMQSKNIEDPLGEAIAYSNLIKNRDLYLEYFGCEVSE